MAKKSPHELPGPAKIGGNNGDDKSAKEPLKVGEFTQLTRIINDPNGPTVPGIDDMIQEIIGRFGSVGEFADSFYQTYKQAPIGSMIRSRMVEKVLDLIRVHSQLNREQDPIEDLSDDELRAILREELGIVDPSGDSDKEPVDAE